MKKIFAFFLALSAGVLASCHKISGNQLDFYYLPSTFTLTDGVTELQSGYGIVFHIDYAAKTLSTTYGGEYGYSQPVVYGGTAPRYLLSIEEGYEGIEEHLLDMAIEGNENSVIYTQGYLLDGSVYGICNVYEDTVGYLSGGGNYGVEEISHSAYYRYERTTDTFEILSRIDGVAMVAFSGEQVIYWKNKKLYAFHTQSQEEKFLCEDYSYDSGLQHQSWGSIYFNETYTLFYFSKTKGSTQTHHAYIFAFNTGEITRLECK